MAPTTRSRILKVWSTKYGLTLTPDSLAWLETLVTHFDLDGQDEDSVKLFGETMEKMARSYTNDTEDYQQIVSTQALEDVYARLKATEGGGGDDEDADENGEDGGQGSGEKYIRVIDAFDMPALHFDGEKKAFVRKADYQKGGKQSIAGRPDSKAMYLRDRYNILKQLILRNEHFSPPALPGHDRENYMKLTGIKNLLGRQGGHFLLFGLLTQSADGRFALEDLDATVALDMSEASPASGMFTEGCFALLDGEYTSENVFKVLEIGHPPSEQRGVSRQVYGHVDFLGTGALTLGEEARLKESEEADGKHFLVFSDLHLDSPKDMQRFAAVLQTYETIDEVLDDEGEPLGSRPPLVILCGNFFQSRELKRSDGKSIQAYQNHFSAFADLILSYPRCARDMHFVFVPGPSDPWDTSSLLLPRRPLPSILVQALQTKLPNVTFASNPCRISYKSQEIVVFREDLMSRMLRNTVRLKTDLSLLAREAMEVERQESERRGIEMDEEGRKGDARKKVLSQFLVQTILDQSHLSPLPLSVRPVMWEFDHALRLFPLPTALVLADKYLPYDVTYEDCLVFNPGSFAGSDYTWSAYDTAKRTVEASGIPR